MKWSFNGWGGKTRNGFPCQSCKTFRSTKLIIYELVINEVLCAIYILNLSMEKIPMDVTGAFVSR